MADMVEELRSTARELLTSGAVQAVVGYGAGSRRTRTTPLIITSADRANELVWNEYCPNNVAVYLTRDEVMRHGKVALVVKGCDAKSVCGLIQEGQVVREKVFLIGMACDGMGEPPLVQCQCCDTHTPKLFDKLIGKATKPETSPSNEYYADVAKIEAMPVEERWKFWQEQLDRCVKCYACRQVCPLCYCKRCASEKNQPQWIASSAHAPGNFSWNVIRAMHLAGRCVGCGACERACPQRIPLLLLNKKMAKEVDEQFHYRAGYDPAAVPAVKTFDAASDCDKIFR